MDRRRFLLTSLAGVLVAPLAAETQQAVKVWRIGWLEITPPTTPAVLKSQDAFVQGLRALGFIEGQNVVFEHQPSLARAVDIVDLKPWSDDEAGSFYKNAFGAVSIEVEADA